MWKAIGLSLAIALSLPNAAADTEAPVGPAQLVESTASDLFLTSGTEATEIVLRLVDERAVARFTLGKYARQLESDEIIAYEQAFESFLRRQVARHSDQFAGVRIEIEHTVQRSPRDAIVTTRVYHNEVGQTLRWRVIERGGRWSVVDLEFAGVWLAIEQRAQINALLDRPGATIDDVIANLG